MLVLSRKPSQQIVIGNCVKVTVVEVRGNTVKLAFEAPQEVSIHREEIHRRIVSETNAPALLVGTDQSRYFAECA